MVSMESTSLFAIKFAREIREDGNPIAMLESRDAAIRAEATTQVPRAMLEEISDMGDPLLNNLRKERIPAIAAKYGYLIKE